MIIRAFILFNDDGSPAVLVLDLTVLDATESIEKFLGHRSGLLTEGVALACVEVVDVRDR